MWGLFFVFVGLFISDFDVGTLNVGSNECALLRLCLQINTKRRIALTLYGSRQIVLMEKICVESRTCNQNQVYLPK